MAHEAAGAPSCAVEGGTEALHLLSHDRGIEIRVVDYEMPGCDPGAFVRRARAFRPELRILGNSALERSVEFAQLGVRVFVRKPWRARDLVEALNRL
jgi:CheY-like chemotaxis protein